MSKQSFSSMEAIIALGALVTSAAAVFIAWDQAKSMRSQEQATVLPVIQIDPYITDPSPKLDIGFKITNAGVGPAFVRRAVLYQNKQPINGYEHLVELMPPGMKLDMEQLTGRTIAPGVERDVLRMSWAGDTDGPDGQRFLAPETVQKIHAGTDNVVLEICYCSTLSRCWVARSGERSDPQPIKACAKPAEGMF